MSTDYRGGPLRVTKLPFCRELRQQMTGAEQTLWRRLRSRQVMGAKFRRQHQFGPYILDFYCEERRLAVEVDGGQHYSSLGAEQDAARTRYLAAKGLRVLRFSNLEVLRETEAVMRRVAGALGEPSP